MDDREFIDIARVERGEGYVATAMIEGSFLDYVPAAASGTTRWECSSSAACFSDDVSNKPKALVSVGVAAGELPCTRGLEFCINEITFSD